MTVPLTPGEIDEQVGDQPVLPAPEPVAPPEPTPIGPFYEIPEGAPSGFTPVPYAVTERDVLSVQLKLNELDFDMSTGERDRLARHLVQNAAPEVMDAFWEDAAIGLAYQRSDDYLKAIGLEQSLRWVYDFLGSPVIDVKAQADAITLAAREESAERYGTIVSAAELLSDRTAIQGEWEANTRALRVETIAAIGSGATGDTGEPTPSGLTRGQWLSSENIQNREAAVGSLEAITKRGGQWAYSGSNLAVQVEDDTGQWQYLVRLDPGTVIESNVDAAIAVLSAERGWAHELDGASRTAPGLQTVGGSLAEMFGHTTRWAERNGLEGVFRFAVEEVPDIAGEMLFGLNERDVVDLEGRTPEEQAIERTRVDMEEVKKTAVNNESAALDVLRFAAADPTNISRDEYQAAAGFVLAMPELVEQIRQDVTVTTDDVIQAIKQEEEETGILVGAFEERVLEPALAAAEWWEHGVQMLGIGFLETLDALQPLLLANPLTAPTAAVFGNPMDATLTQSVEAALAGNMDEAYGVWKAAFDEAYESNTVADYLGIDEETSFGQWVNLAASIGFDPATWIFPGGKGAMKWAAEMASNPALAGKLARSRPIQSWGRQIVERTGDDAMLVVIEGSATMSPNMKLRLRTIATTEYTDRAAREQALAEFSSVVEDGLRNSTFLPQLPARAVTRRNAEGISRMFRRFGEANPTQQNRLATLLMPASRTRSVSIGPREFIDEATELIVTRGKNVVDEYNKLLDLWVEVTDPVARNELAAAVAHKQKQLADDIAKRKAALSPDARQVQQLRKQRATATRLLNDMQTRGATGTQEVIDEIGRLDRLIARAGQEYDDYVAAVTPLGNEITALGRQKHHIQEAKPYTKLEEWFHEFFDDWGREIGLDEIDEVNPYLPDGRKQLNWGEVHFDSGYVPTESNVRDLAALGENVDVDALLAAGRGARKGRTVLPASPVEVLAYSALPKKHRQAWNKTLRQNKAARASARVALWTQSVFSASVLLNPLTALRTHLDEVVRFYEQTGQTMKSLQTLLPNRAGGMFGVSAEARAFGRGLDTFSAGRPWRWTDPSDKANFTHATERYVNGNLLEDDVFKAYVRAANSSKDEAAQRAHFTTWWETEGHQFRRKTTFSGKEVNADFAFDLNKNTWELTKGQMTDELAEKIWQATTKNRKLSTSDLGWTRGWKGKVPLQDTKPPRKGPASWMIDKGFDHLFGSPAGRRGAIIYDHYFDYSKDIFARRFEGRIITPELLANKYGLDIEDAIEYVRQGNRNQYIRDEIAKHGMILQSDLDDAAARWAAKNADAMMYQMGAVSIFGKKTQRFYPYGRAQVDYVQYWMNRAMSPTIIRNPFAAGGMSTIGAAGRDLPLNLRLVNRLSKMMAHVNPEDPYADHGRSPTWALNTFTFTPDKWSGMDIQDALVPAPGPVPGWAVNWLDEDNPLRQTYETVHPAHAVFHDYKNQDIGTGLRNLFNALVPDSTTSLRGQARGLAKAVLAAVGNFAPDDALVNGVMEGMIVDAESPGQREFVGEGTAEWLVGIDPDTGIANVFAWTPSTGVDEHGEVFSQYKKIITDATLKGYTKDTWELLRKLTGQTGHYGTDQSYARFYAGISSLVDGYVDAGYATDSQRDDFRASEAQVADWLNGGDADSKDIIAYADAARDILEYLPEEVLAEFLILNPDALVNFVSQFEVDERLVPEEYADQVSGGRIVGIGEQNRETRRAARDGDWLLTRPFEDIIFDRHRRGHRAARDYTRYAYEELTGLTWARQLAPKSKFNDDGTPRDNYAGNTVKAGANWRGFDVLAKTGFEIPDEWLQPDGTIKATIGEVRDVLGAHMDKFVYQFELSNELESRVAKLDSQLGSETLRTAAEREGWDADLTSDATVVSYFGSQLWDNYTTWVRDIERQTGWVSPEEWDDDHLSESGIRLGDVKESFRQRFKVAAALNREFNVDHYNGFGLNRQLGDLDWETPDPPPVNELEYRFDVSPGGIQVVDGDTVEVNTADGTVVFRLMGINTPEKEQIGAAQAATNLQRFLDNHPDNIVIGVFNPSLFGRTQSFRAFEGDAVVERNRVFGWLYVDGVPIYDPSVFTADNPRGVGIGGNVPDFESMLGRETS